MKNSNKLSKKDKQLIAMAFSKVLDEPFYLSLSYANKEDGIETSVQGNAGHCIIGCIAFLFSLLDEHNVPHSRVKDLVDILDDGISFDTDVKK